jgi:hypothetical protein
MNLNCKYPWPYFIDEDTRTVYTHVASGWPTVMGVPIKVKEHFGSDCDSKLVSLNYLEELQK